MMKVIFVDFCDTLVPYQTGDKFLYYMVKRDRRMLKRYTVDLVYNRVVLKLLSKTVPSFRPRDFLLKRVKGISQTSLDRYAREYASKIHKDLNCEMVKLLEECRNSNFKIFIVSGGYYHYLQFVFPKGKIDGIIATKLEIVNGTLSGRLDGAACLGEEKVTRIHNTIGIDFDVNESRVYSDCMSDKPMFSLVRDERYLVTLPKVKSSGVVMQKLGQV